MCCVLLFSFEFPFTTNVKELGITWLELLILYEAHGGIDRPKGFQRWSQISAKKKKDRTEAEKVELHKIHEENLNKRAEFMKEMGDFKRDFRAAVALAVPHDWVEALQASKSPINRLAVVGSKTKQLALRAIPMLCEEDREVIRRAILRHMGHGKIGRAHI